MQSRLFRLSRCCNQRISACRNDNSYDCSLARQTCPYGHHRLPARRHNHRNHRPGPYRRSLLDASLSPALSPASSRKREVSAAAAVVARLVVATVALMCVTVRVCGQSQAVAVLRRASLSCYLFHIRLLCSLGSPADSGVLCIACSSGLLSL